MKWVMDHAAYERMVNDPDEMVGRYLTIVAAKLKILAKAQAGYKTGALRNSINYRVVHSGGGLVAFVGSDNRVAFMHHEGTRPHIIAARRAQTLRFYSRGRIVYAKVVRHPGTRPNKYLTDNLRKVI